MPYTVILFGSPCEEYPGMACPMTAIGPLETREEAEAVAENYLGTADWTKPHILTLDREL